MAMCVNKFLNECHLIMVLYGCKAIVAKLANPRLECATSAANTQVPLNLSKAATKCGPYNIFSPELIDDLKVPKC